MHGRIKGTMTIYLGSDHGGFWLKENVKSWLTEWSYTFKDLGAHSLEPEDDFPKYAFAVAESVAAEKDSLGILFCRSGGGMAIAANRVPGIRAVEVYDVRSAQHAKTKNDANIITLGGDWLSEEQTKVIIKTWLVTNFNNQEKYNRRIAQLDQKQFVSAA